jgi:hypothetical protein
MSNTAHIQQQTTVVKHSGEKSYEVAVFDDYGSEHVDLDVLRDEGTFYEDPVELLRALVGLAKGNDYPTLTDILEHIRDQATGMFVEGIYYPWERVDAIFREEGFGAQSATTTESGQ